MVCAAARLVAMARHNFLDGLHPKLVMASDEGEPGLTPKDVFIEQYKTFWVSMLQTLSINTEVDRHLQAQRVSAALQQTREQERTAQPAM